MDGRPHVGEWVVGVFGRRAKEGEVGEGKGAAGRAGGGGEERERLLQ